MDRVADRMARDRAEIPEDMIALVDSGDISSATVHWQSVARKLAEDKADLLVALKHIWAQHRDPWGDSTCSDCHICIMAQAAIDKAEPSPAP